jgi:hypothetical protein
MRYIYYVNGKKFTTDFYYRVPWGEVSSYSENTPAYEDTLTGEKLWCLKGIIYHRLTGPAFIRGDGSIEFYLNDKRYENVKEWINNHPNPDLYFNAIGVFTETDKILWYLKN